MSARRRLRSSINQNHPIVPPPEEANFSVNSNLKVKFSKREQLESTLRFRLKKLGVTNIEEHLKSANAISNGEESTSLRKTRSSIKPLLDLSPPILAPLSEPSTSRDHHEIVGDIPSTSKGRPNSTPKSTRKPRSGKDSNLRKKSTVSTLLKAAKSMSRKRNSEYDSEEDSEQPKKRMVKCTSAEAEGSANSRCGSEFGESEQFEEEDCCKVPGCDSSGHLSGAFLTHRTLDTCPIFHNQTAEECVERYRKRRQPVSNIKKSPNKRNQSPSKRDKNRILEADPNWTAIMEKRKAEMLEITGSQIGEAMSLITLSRQHNLNSFTPNFDVDLYLDAQSRTAELIHHNSALELTSDSETTATNYNSGVQSIVLGKQLIDVWYSSPYSDDFQNCLKLYICEYCLKCMNSSLILQRHATKCSRRHPPGNEIYRKGTVSFFEIDGNKQKEYCQNLCLLAKLFLNYKTLFFDVEPFLFYVMTVCGEQGMHLVGYFSKEKFCSTNNNVSCILTLPTYQRLGYGRMLIDFSYLLTKAEGKVGTPEKPLSDLGLISYRSYWKLVVMDYLSTFEGKDIQLKDMSQQTGIIASDIVSTLQLMGLLKYWKQTHLILVPPEAKSQFAAEVKKKRKLYADKVIDPKCLHWEPKNWPRTK